VQNGSDTSDGRNWNQARKHIMALHGLKIALAEGRQLEELAQMLEKEGAVPLRCPMVSILDAPDPAPVLAWVRELIAGQFHLVILMTGEAVRRLLRLAEEAGLRPAAVHALGGATTLTRGPKPALALKEIGLTPRLVAQKPTTDGVIATLADMPLAGQTVGLTLYGEPNPRLVEFLESAGARVRTVMPYVFAPAADADRITELIDNLAAGKVDVAIFTSSPQVERLYEVAAERGKTAELQEGLSRTRVAAVGPVVAETLRQKGATVAICPEQGYVMKNLVKQIERSLAGG
jgi:uroporphyrinogen-III synthase